MIDFSLLGSSNLLGSFLGTLLAGLLATLGGSLLDLLGACLLSDLLGDSGDRDFLGSSTGYNND